MARRRKRPHRAVPAPARDARDAPPARDARDARAGRGRAAGVLVALGWAALIAVVGGASIFWGAVGGASVTWYVIPRLFGGRQQAYGLGIGFAAGVAVACWFAHRGRHWVLRWRLRRLRSAGVHAMASIAHVERRHRTRARGGSSTTYDLVLKWDDPHDGGSYRLRRRYRFASIARSSISPEFEKLQVGRTVTVSYPPGRPWRLVADIPFAPTMADLLT